MDSIGLQNRALTKLRAKFKKKLKRLRLELGNYRMVFDTHNEEFVDFDDKTSQRFEDVEDVVFEEMSSFEERMDKKLKKLVKRITKENENFFNRQTNKRRRDEPSDDFDTEDDAPPPPPPKKRRVERGVTSKPRLKMARACRKFANVSGSRKPSTTRPKKLLFKSKATQPPSSSIQSNSATQKPRRKPKASKLSTKKTKKKRSFREYKEDNHRASMMATARMDAIDAGELECVPDPLPKKKPRYLEFKRSQGERNSLFLHDCPGEMVTVWDPVRAEQGLCAWKFQVAFMNWKYGGSVCKCIRDYFPVIKDWLKPNPLELDRWTEHIGWPGRWPGTSFDRMVFDYLGEIFVAVGFSGTEYFLAHVGNGERFDMPVNFDIFNQHVNVFNPDRPRNDDDGY